MIIERKLNLMVNVNLNYMNCLVWLVELFGSLLDIGSIVFIEKINVGRL